MHRRPRAVLASLALALVTLFAALPVAPAAVVAAPDEPPDATYFRTMSANYGISVFLRGRADALQTLQGAQAAGFVWQKSLFRWRDIEGAAKGEFHWDEADALVRATEDAELRLVARVDFQPAWARLDGANNGPPDNGQDYADFVHTLVERYKRGGQRGRIHAIEIWNEPNLSREWGGQPITQQSATQYVQLLCAAYAAAKQADPYVTVVSAGLSPTGIADGTAQPDDVYLQWLYDAGMQGCYDVLGAHAPGFKAAPSVSPEEAAATPELGGHRSFTFRRVEDLRAIMERNGEGAKQVWILEFGWTSDTTNPAYAWHAVSEETKAQYIVDAYLWARQHWQPWVGLMVAWNMADATWTPVNEEYWWSITDPDGSPRPALLQFAQARASGLLPDKPLGGADLPGQSVAGGE